MQYKQIKICEPYVIWLTKYLQSSVHSLIFFSGVVLLFFPCISLLLVYSNFGQASVYKIKEYNRKCDNRICWNCRFKIQCRKNGQKIGLFSSWVKKCIKEEKKMREHYFWFLMSSSISVISHPVPVVCVMNGRQRFTSKWNWMSRLCRIAINLRVKRQSDKIIPIYIRSFRLRNWLFTNIVNIISCEEGMKSRWFPHGITDSRLVVVKNGGMERFKS